MGALFSALCRCSTPLEYKLIIVGLDNAGKTTTLYKLHLGEVVMTQPTIGVTSSSKHNNVHFEVWDLGGQQTLRNSWQSYYRNTASVIIWLTVRTEEDEARQGGTVQAVGVRGVESSERAGVW